MPEVKRYACDVTEKSQLPMLLKWVKVMQPSIISTREAAYYIGYSEEYFCRWFRRRLGITFQDYIRRLRISEACRMLREGKSVSEISLRLGYENPSSFVKIFKHYMHQTPGGYIASVNLSESEEKDYEYKCSVPEYLQQ